MKNLNGKKEEKKIEYLNSGITLIALVITIIILLILAGITIGSLSGKDGIIHRTFTAKDRYLESGKNETEGLNYLEGVIDDSQNNIPQISTTNTHFTLSPSTWTNGSVTVTATTDIEGYTLQTSQDASTWTSETTQTFSENGTIYARLINKLGEVSQYASTNVTNIDKTKPIAGTLTMKLDSSSGTAYTNNTWTNHSVYIAPVNGSDAQSGHKSTTYSVTGTKTLSNQTVATTLTDTGTYTITVTTTDNAGNTATRGEYTIIIKKLQIGDTVAYTPASTTYTWQAAYSGNSSDVALDNTTSNYKLTEWKVFDIKQDGTVELISANPTAGTVYLGKAQGYNNAVKLLNDACNTLYGNTAKGITGRSIKIEDIENRMTDTALASAYSYANGAKYNNQVTSAYSSSNSNYPIIYANEKLSVINGNKKTEGLGFSEQTNFIGATDNGATAGKLRTTSIQPYQTYWYKDNSFMQSAFSGEGTNTANVNYNLIMPKGSNTTYWVASRCVNTFSTNCYFNVRYVNSGFVSAFFMCECDSYTNSYGRSLALRPVVSLSSKLLSGNDTDGWSIK